MILNYPLSLQYRDNKHKAVGLWEQDIMTLNPKPMTWFPVGDILNMIVLNPYEGFYYSKNGKIVSNKDPVTVFATAP